MEILLSTRNRDKRRELSQMMGEEIVLHHPEEYFEEDIEETGTSLWENALLKAQYGYDKSGLPTLADDTGLEVDALEGAPGVYSSRYAGLEATYDDNVNKLLEELDGVEVLKRGARFRTVIAFIHHGASKRFDGVLEGKIIGVKRGSSGFGYDPVFLPHNHQQTLAELDLELKNQISHRGRAFRAFKIWLYSNKSVVFD
ncbi:RdgB/HAM1 family non-canonical purine NTP pyrophosphatase [bacterium]|nr:RdgB/HAM1 family non-canonical purine NTP pyrophosphatase [bacterium]